MIAESQFKIADHYDAMSQLDEPVHNDQELARTETDLAISLLPAIPASVFLPCFGTGRHIQYLLNAGVKRIVGVDLSPDCVAIAKQQFADDDRVELHVADLCTWESKEQFDAVILLGNSWADVTSFELLKKMTKGMIQRIKPDGLFIMDFIGDAYLERCEKGISTCWDGFFNGRSVKDYRTPRFIKETSVMSIAVEAIDAVNDKVLYSGHYDKLIFDNIELIEFFDELGLSMQTIGQAYQVNLDYYGERDPTELGMLALSHWWVGTIN